ncbi:hypothetical protein C8Q76DRAFT_695015 [Earliella scabrosa]|nr:hypothetical protein C8Q76DRAFT_695015 [Earliella scabrosa]
MCGASAICALATLTVHPPACAGVPVASIRRSLHTASASPFVRSCLCATAPPSGARLVTNPFALAVGPLPNNAPHALCPPPIYVTLLYRWRHRLSFLDHHHLPWASPRDPARLRYPPASASARGALAFHCGHLHIPPLRCFTSSSRCMATKYYGKNSTSVPMWVRNRFLKDATEYQGKAITYAMKRTLTRVPFALVNSRLWRALRYTNIIRDSRIFDHLSYYSRLAPNNTG